MAKLDNIQSILESSIVSDVFLAFSLIAEEDFAKQLIELHGEELCSPTRTQTVRQLYSSIKKASENYQKINLRNQVKKFADFYTLEAKLFIEFAKNHII